MGDGDANGMLALIAFTDKGKVRRSRPLIQPRSARRTTLNVRLKMKTILATIFAFSVGLILTQTLHAEPENLQRNLQSALDQHDLKALHSFFNFQGVAPKTKVIFDDIIKEVCSWDSGRVTVVPFSGKRLEEFHKTKTTLNGNPTADVFFKHSNKSKIGYSMLAGASDHGFLILIATEQ